MIAGNGFKDSFTLTEEKTDKARTVRINVYVKEALRTLTLMIIHSSLGREISYLQKILNHGSQSTTLRYIGIEQGEINDIFDNLK